MRRLMPWGQIATPMASGDVFTGLQQGTIDAAENAIANLIANRYYEITKKRNMDQSCFWLYGRVYVGQGMESDTG